MPNVANVSILYEHDPFSTRDVLNMDLSIDGLRRTSAPKGVSSRIGRVVQHAQHIVVLDLSPGDFPVMRSASHSPWKEQMLFAKVAYGRAR